MENVASVMSPQIPTEAKKAARYQMYRMGLSEERRTASAARENRREAEYFVSPAVLASRS